MALQARPILVLTLAQLLGQFRLDTRQPLVGNPLVQLRNLPEACERTAYQKARFMSVASNAASIIPDHLRRGKGEPPHQIRHISVEHWLVV